MGFAGARIHRRPTALTILGAVLVFAVACKKSVVSPSQSPSVQLTLPAPSSEISTAPEAAEKSKLQTEHDAKFYRYIERRFAANPSKKMGMLRTAHELNAWADAHEKLLAIHHATMVTPPPPGFKPEPIARRIRLKLTLEKTAIHRGERLRFHLEMMNVGREAIVYDPLDSSIFMSGSLIDTRNIQFMLTNPNNEKSSLQPPLPLEDGTPTTTEVQIPKGLTDAEAEAWLQETNAASEAGGHFEVKLEPGETLRNLGDGDSPQAPYHTLITAAPFDNAGTYQLQVELDDRPAPLDKKYVEYSLRFSTLEEIHKTYDQRMKDALGPVSSNTVTFEVAP